MKHICVPFLITERAESRALRNERNGKGCQVQMPSDSSGQMIYQLGFHIPYTKQV